MVQRGAADLREHGPRGSRTELSVPASSAVLERDFSTAGLLITGSRSNPSAAYAEMGMLLNGSIERMPIEVPALSNEQALQAVPRRLSNPKAEVTALAAGSAGSAAVDAAYDGYAGEAGSTGEEIINAGCGDSAGEGSD